MDCSSVEIKDDTYVETKIRYKIFCPDYDEEAWPGTKPLKVDFIFRLVAFTFVSFLGCFDRISCFDFNFYTVRR